MKYWYLFYLFQFTHLRACWGLWGMLAAPFPFSFVFIPSFIYCDAWVYSHSSTPPGSWLTFQLCFERPPTLMLCPGWVGPRCLCCFLSLFFCRTFSLPRFLLFCFHLLRCYHGPAEIGLPSTSSGQPQLEMISFLESYKHSLLYLQLFHLANIYWVWIYTRYHARQCRDK